MMQFQQIFRILKTDLTLFTLMALFISCSPKPKEVDIHNSGTPVQVTSPRRVTLTETIDLNANTIFLKKEIVRATFQGFIEKINKNIGDEVKTGNLLFRIKTKESVADDNLKLTFGAKTFQGSVSVRAQSDGILTALNYHTGDFVAEGEEIAIISNPSSLRISLNVPYQYVSKINQHSPCKIYLPDGKMLPATIQKVIPSVDPVSQTQTFLLRLDEPVNLPENLNVDTRLALRTINDALVLPLTTILSNETQDEFWVMKLINDTTAVHVNIKKGIETDSLVQIISPEFNLTDRIISEGAYGLPDTAKVLPTSQDHE
jgi:multidrug efflux pump subunit AcrA (membrane-fusion protein)